MFGKVRDMSYVPAGLMGFDYRPAKSVWEVSRPIRKWPESHRALDRRPGKNDLVVVDDGKSITLKVDYYESRKVGRDGCRTLSCPLRQAPRSVLPPGGLDECHVRAHERAVSLDSWPRDQSTHARLAVGS